LTNVIEGNAANMDGADVNEDGEIDINDVLEILKYLADLRPNSIYERTGLRV
jgi:hypothetical protein